MCFLFDQSSLYNSLAIPNPFTIKPVRLQGQASQMPGAGLAQQDFACHSQGPRSPPSNLRRNHTSLRRAQHTCRPSQDGGREKQMTTGVREAAQALAVFLPVISARLGTRPHSPGPRLCCPLPGYHPVVCPFSLSANSCMDTSDHARHSPLSHWPLQCLPDLAQIMFPSLSLVVMVPNSSSGCFPR